MDFSAIREQLVTTGQAERFVNQLDDLASCLYIETDSFFKKMNTIFSTDMSDAFNLFIKMNAIDVTNKQVMANVLTDLKNHIRALPKIRLRLAVEPTAADAAVFASWIERCFKEKVFIDYEVTHEILAGAQIEYNGKYGDYSLTV